MLKRGLRYVLWVLGGAGEVLVAAYAVPLGILVVGIPIALGVRLVLWTVGAL
jgi:fumarate reductase subunit D